MGVDLGTVVSDRDREVRLGLVMYGGVSLAIYINGVAHEFFRAVHGNGVYKLLKELTDSDIVVDIVSGTSAGGINGIFLGYALANGKDFGVMADLWRNHGDISRLLRDPEKPSGQEQFSVLDSEGYYHPRLEEAYELMDQTPYLGTGDAPSTLRELDLFVTGTDVDGNIYTVMDNSGHAIDVKDHRAAFQLKHRHGRRHPFGHDGTPAGAKASYRALATLSRLTSCFPAAFASVEVKGPGWAAANQPLDPDDTNTASAHDLLREWGKLDHRRYFLDGGVLDNKPFTYTIREMVYRTKDREIERHLFYVEPDPERFDRAKQTQARDAVEQPTVTKAAMAGAFSIPSYESIAADLQLLSDYNASVIQYEAICGRTAQARGVTQPYQVAPMRVDECCNRMYAAARQTQLAQRAVKGILRENGRDVMLSEQLRESAELLVEAFHRHPSGDPERTATEFDIYFRQRRLFHVTERLRKVVKETRSTERRRSARALLMGLNRHMKLLEILRFWMEKLIDDASFGWQTTVTTSDGNRELVASSLWDRVKRAFQLLLQPGSGFDDVPRPRALTSPEDEPLNQKTLSAVYDILRRRHHEIVAASKSGGGILMTAPDPDYRGALHDVDTMEQERFAIYAGTFPELADIEREYRYFLEIDACLFPVQLFSGVDEREIVRITRISPADAQRGFSRRPLAEKVAGDDVAHFSGFFKRSWRSNDILWGRLDASCQIIETLLTRKRLTELAPAYLQSLAALAGSLSTTFPHATPAQFAPVETWLTSLGTGSVPDQAQHDAAVTRLIELAQMEVLWEGLPFVLEDAAAQDDEWRQPTKDKTVSLNEARASTQTTMDSMVQTADVPIPQQTALGRYFTTNYNVGKESVVSDIPSVVRLDMAFTAARVARSSLLGSLGGSTGPAARGSKLLRFFGTALDVFGRFFHTARYDKQLTTIITTALLTLSIGALLAGVLLWRDVLLDDTDSLVLKRFVLLIVAPVIVLLTYAKVRGSAKLRLALLGLIIVAALAGAVFIVKDLRFSIERKHPSASAAETTPAPPSAPRTTVRSP